KRIVRDSASFRTASTVRTMARLTERSVRGFSPVNVACGRRRIRRRVRAIERFGIAPARLNAADYRIDLFLREHPAGPLRERRHRRLARAVSDDPAHRAFVHEREVDGVGERDRGASATVGAMATGAIAGIQRVELDD